MNKVFCIDCYYHTVSDYENGIYHKCRYMQAHILTDTPIEQERNTQCIIINKENNCTHFSMRKKAEKRFLGIKYGKYKVE